MERRREQQFVAEAAAAAAAAQRRGEIRKENIALQKEEGLI